MLHVPVTVSPELSALVRFLTESHMSSQDFGSGIVGIGLGKAVAKGGGRTVGKNVVPQYMTMTVV